MVERASSTTVSIADPKRLTLMIVVYEMVTAPTARAPRSARLTSLPPRDNLAATQLSFWVRSNCRGGRGKVAWAWFLSRSRLGRMA